MCKLFHHIVFVVFLSTELVFASDKTSPEKIVAVKDLIEQSNEELISLLSDNDFAIREAAMTELWKRGEKAFKPVKRAAEQSRSPETRHRARMLVRYISTGLAHDVLERYSTQIELFKEMSQKEQSLLLNRFYNERHYSLMFYLLNKIEDPDLVAQHLEDYDNLARKAARALVAVGHYEGAIEYLRYVPHPDYQLLLSIAHIVHLQGNVDIALAELPTEAQSYEQRLWKLALLAQKADITALRNFEPQDDFKLLSPLLDFIEGDAIGVLQNQAPEKRENKTATKEFLRMYRQGSTTPSADYFKLLENEIFVNKVKPGSEFTQMCFIILQHLKLLNGDFEEFDSIMEKRYSEYSMDYFVSTEQSTRMLKNLGITDRKSRQKYVERLLNEKEGKRQDAWLRAWLPPIERIAKLVAFYYNRGEKDIAREIANSVIEKIRKDQKQKGKPAIAVALHDFFIILEKINATQFCMELIIEQKNDAIVDRYFEKQPNNSNVFHALKAIEVNKVKRFEIYCALMGYLPELHAQQAKWQEQWWEKLKTYNNKKKEHGLEQMVIAADHRSDSNSQLWLIPELKKLKSNFFQSILRKGLSDVELTRMDEYYITALENSEQHQAHVDFCKKNYHLIQTRPKQLTRYALSLKQLGDLKEANKALEQAWAVTLGELREQLLILNVLIDSQEYELAVKYADKMFFFIDPTQPDLMYNDLISLVESLDSLNAEYMKLHRFKFVHALTAFQINTRLNYSNIDLKPREYIYSKMIIQNYLGSLAALQWKAENHKEAKKLLRKAYLITMKEGGGANHFLQFMRQLPYSKVYDQCVTATIEHYEKEIQAFPKCGNTRNSLAWILSRAVRSLDKAEEHSKISLTLDFDNLAYIDTMAEIQFAKGNRVKAIDYSIKALKHHLAGKHEEPLIQNFAYPMFWNLKKQKIRFQNDDFPSAKCASQ